MTSGICFCKENIAEPDCSQCAEGYYGNPSIGEVCLQCPCPLTNNSHSPSCFIDSDDLITCDKCDPQYSGRDCGECSDGFFGDPVVRHIYNNKTIYCEERSNVKYCILYVRMSHSSWTSVEYEPPSLVVYYKYKQLHCLDSKAKWGGGGGGLVNLLCDRNFGYITK